MKEKNRELELAFAALEQKNRELEEASLAKTQILATTTHELKTPLTSILDYIDRMLVRQDSVGQLNNKQQRYLETVQKNAHRLKSLVDDLLDVSRIEAGILKLCLLDLDIRSEIGDVVQSMNHQFSEKGIEVIIGLPPDLGKARADRLRFGQIMGNLLSNTCKYSPPGSRVTVTASENRHMVQTDVDVCHRPGHQPVPATEQNHCISGPEVTEGEDPAALLNDLSQAIEGLSRGAEFIVVDSITDLAGSCPKQSVISFFSTCRRLGNKGRTIFVAVHSYAFGSEMFARLRTLCHGYLTLGSEQVRGKNVRTLEVNKINTTELSRDNTVAFLVEADVGMRLIPLNKSRA